MQQDAATLQGQSKQNNFNNKDRDNRASMKNGSASAINTASDIGEKASDLAHNVANSVSELGKITKEFATDAFHKLEDNASAYYEKGISEAKHLEKKIENNIRENPTKSMLIAAGVGLLAWALWNRK